MLTIKSRRRDFAALFRLLPLVLGIKKPSALTEGFKLRCLSRRIYFFLRAAFLVAFFLVAFLAAFFFLAIVVSSMDE